jgi:hypothetical protein
VPSGRGLAALATEEAANLCEARQCSDVEFPHQHREDQEEDDRHQADPCSAPGSATVVATPPMGTCGVVRHSA